MTPEERAESSARLAALIAELNKPVATFLAWAASVIVAWTLTELFWPHSVVLAGVTALVLSIAFTQYALPRADRWSVERQRRQAGADR